MKNQPSFGTIILAAAIFLGAFLVFKSLLDVREASISLQAARLARGPEEISLKKDQEKQTMPLEIIPREARREDVLEDYEREDRKPGLLQVFRMGERLPQKKVEDTEYVQSVTFRRHVATGRVMADVTLFNDSSSPIRPRFQVMLFSDSGRFLCRDTILYITDELLPGQKKTETMSFPQGPHGVGYFEVRKLE